MGPIEWPPGSPYLTPLDFYLWGHVKALVYSVKNVVLEDRILDACAGIQLDILVKVHHEWEERTALTLEHGGQHEHIL